MNELIQNSRTIYVHIGGEYVLQNKGILFELYCESHTLDEPVHIEGYYGTRLEVLTTPVSIKERNFERLCEYLKKHRITCGELLLHDSIWRREQCATLIKILKPVKVDLLSDEEQGDRFEALLNCTTPVRVVYFKFQRFICFRSM